MEAEQDHGGQEKESSVNIYTAAVDAATSALRYAQDSENIAMQARISSRIGYIYFKCMFKPEDQKIALLTRAQASYSKMLHFVG